MILRTSIRGRTLRAASFAIAGALSLLAAPRDAKPAVADGNNLCDQAGEAPDIIVGEISGDHIVADVRRWGTIGGITAYSFSATSCNIGTCWAEWFENENTHPVIAQNMFELIDGRFQQIGQSWIKHAWGADTGSKCGTCNPGDYSHMGVNCSDLYDTSGNGGQNRLGAKHDVNPYTGYYQPLVGSLATGNAIYKRLQVHNSDLDPATNPGAKYFVEVQYVHPGDALAHNGDNNVSYRPLTVSGSAASSFNLTLTGETVVGQPAIMAWKAADPSVMITEAHLPGDGRLYLGTKVTYRGGGIWRYEYAIQNVNAAYAPDSIAIPLPPGSTVSGTSYHDVDYHSGDVQDNTPWGLLIGSSTVRWSAAAQPGSEVVQNSLRWGTLYNFRVDVNAPPGTHAIVLWYKDPEHPVFSQSVATLTPSLCDSDGVCDTGETCATCPGDCASQGGGSGCCGDGSCQAGETDATCFADCGQPLAAETLCGDGIDGDRDGSIDCFDTDCCADPACDVFDVDGDGLAATCDCSDADRAVWKTPGEVQDLQVFHGLGVTSLTWAQPSDAGSSSIGFDLIRSADPNDFATASTCLAVDPGVTSATDPAETPAGSGMFYLVRAKNACPAGIGSLGSASSGAPRTAPPCP